MTGLWLSSISPRWVQVGRRAGEAVEADVLGRQKLVADQDIADELEAPASLPGRVRSLGLDGLRVVEVHDEGQMVLLFPGDLDEGVLLPAHGLSGCIQGQPPEGPLLRAEKIPGEGGLGRYGRVELALLEDDAPDIAAEGSLHALGALGQPHAVHDTPGNGFMDQGIVAKACREGLGVNQAGEELLLGELRLGRDEIHRIRRIPGEALRHVGSRPADGSGKAQQDDQ